MPEPHSDDRASASEAAYQAGGDSQEAARAGGHASVAALALAYGLSVTALYLHPRWRPRWWLRLIGVDKSAYTSEDHVNSFSRSPEELAALRQEAQVANAEAKAHTRNPDGADLIGQERRRQVWQEGWTPEHDAEHTDGALIKAAVTYAREALWAVQHPDVEFDPTLALTIRDDQGTPASTWPWDAKWWKPNADPVLNLIKAGALIAAEIDRLRATSQTALLPAPEFETDA